MGNPVKVTNLYNITVNRANSQCAWSQLQLGNYLQMYEISDRLWQNAQGYGEADANTAWTNANTKQMNFHVTKQMYRGVYINETVSPIYVEYYECIPRHDINRALSTPYDLMQYDAQDQNLPASGSSPMGFEDPRFTPYMCPPLVSHYKIRRVRKFKVNPGQQWFYKFSNNDYSIKPELDLTSADSIRKSKTKFTLMKTYGELGVVTETGTGTKYLRHMSHEVVCKLQYECWGHLDEETRVIIMEQSTTKNAPLSVTAETYTDQVTANIAGNAILAASISTN